MLARRSSPPDNALGRNTRPSLWARPASPYPDNASTQGHFPGSLACHVTGLPLRPDIYSFNVFVGGNHAVHDYVMRAMTFEVAPTDVFGTGRLPERNQGVMMVDYRWSAVERHLAIS